MQTCTLLTRSYSRRLQRAARPYSSGVSSQLQAGNAWRPATAGSHTQASRPSFAVALRVPCFGRQDKRGLHTAPLFRVFGRVYQDTTAAPPTSFGGCLSELSRTHGHCHRIPDPARRCDFPSRARAARKNARAVGALYPRVFEPHGFVRSLHYRHTMLGLRSTPESDQRAAPDMTTPSWGVANPEHVSGLALPYCFKVAGTRSGPLAEASFQGAHHLMSAELLWD